MAVVEVCNIDPCRETAAVNRPRRGRLLDARLKLALAIRQQRQARGLSQKELGAKLKTTQPRVAKIERAASDVSMDQLIRAFTAAGGKFILRTSNSRAAKGKSRSKKRGAVLKAVASL